MHFALIHFNSFCAPEVNSHSTTSRACVVSARARGRQKALTNRQITRGCIHAVRIVAHRVRRSHSSSVFAPPLLSTSELTPASASFIAVGGFSTSRN